VALDVDKNKNIETMRKKIQPARIETRIIFSLLSCHHSSQAWRKLYFLIAFLCILSFDAYPEASGSLPQANMQEIVIRGNVTSGEDGSALPGVSVSVKGSNLATVTNTAGDYTIQVPDRNSVLVFSYIGYVSVEIPIGDKTSIDAALTPDLKSLDDVIVVGYGTQRKRDVTGSVASVSSSQIEKIPVSSLDQALQGQVAGVQVMASDGAPGGNINVLIRGVGSISNSNAPLYVIDGLPGVEGGNSINPSDIASIEILKDASATAIYGSRGANGVVLITTKGGQEGQNLVELDASYGFQQASKRLDLMNAQEYAEMVVDGRNNGWLERGGPGASIDDPNSVRAGSYKIQEKYLHPENLQTTDFQDYIFQTAPFQKYQLTASGGKKDLRYYMSGEFFDQEGIIIETGMKRYSLRSKIDAELSDRLKLQLILAPTYLTQDKANTTGHYQSRGVLLSAWAMPPDVPMYNEDGSYGTEMDDLEYGFGVENPVKIAKYYDNQSNRFGLTGNFSLEYSILPALSLKVSLGTDVDYSNDRTWKPSTIGSSGRLAESPATATSLKSNNLDIINENILNYKKAFANKHNIDALLGFTVQKTTRSGTLLNAEAFPDDLIENVNGGTVFQKSRESASETRLLSYLSRINYQYDDRYLVTATIRADGSSRFGNNNKWGIFPSASVGWNIAREQFMQHVRFLSDLKIRTSYGISGNDAIGDYRHIGLLSISNYVLGNNRVPGMIANTFSNNDLGWESTKQFDIGMDIGLLKNRIYLVADYYNKLNSNMLLNISTPSATGFTNALVNIGEVENKGLELAITTRNFTGEFEWTSNFNISFNKNKVLKLGTVGERIFGDAGRGNTSITEVGYPIGSFYGHVALGIYQSLQQVNDYGTQEFAQPGDVIFKDVNKDGSITDLDREIMGSPFPDYHYGFNNTFSYKGFDLSVLINGTHGNMIYNATSDFLYNVAGVQNNLKSVHTGRWRSPEQPGDGKTSRAIRGGRNNNFQYNSNFLEDGSFLRIRNINLGYTLPSAILQRAYIKRARIYLSAANLYTFTKYAGLDPEVSNSGSDYTAAGVDYGGYPLPRTITLGCKLTF